ncbi:MAG: hypothetical protein AAF590_09700 [Pseudomonadota bacterium]
MIDATSIAQMTLIPKAPMTMEACLGVIWLRLVALNWLAMALAMRITGSHGVTRPSRRHR